MTSCHWRSAPRVAPNASPPTPIAITMAPSQSNEPSASSSRLSSDDRRRVQGNEDERHVDEECGSPADRLDQESAEERTEDHGGRGAGRPQADRPSAVLALERGGDDREAAGYEQRPEGALYQPGQDEELHVRCQPAGDRRRAESDQADAEHAPPSVEVADAAGQDQQRGQDREVAAVDVREALDAAHEGRRQLATDRFEGDVHDRAVQEDDGRSENDRQQSAESGAHAVILRPRCPVTRSVRNGP